MFSIPLSATLGNKEGRVLEGETMATLSSSLSLVGFWNSLIDAHF